MDKSLQLTFLAHPVIYNIDIYISTSYRLHPHYTISVVKINYNYQL